MEKLFVTMASSPHMVDELEKAFQVIMPLIRLWSFRCVSRIAEWALAYRRCYEMEYPPK